MYKLSENNNVKSEAEDGRDSRLVIMNETKLLGLCEDMMRSENS